MSEAVRTESDIARAEVRRYQSYKLADELRRSSDDLTRMARLYVVTGDARYKAYFDRILAIRDGHAPRPIDYDDIYWDFVVAWGKPPRRDEGSVSLEQLMRDAHFTDDELALLQLAKQRSDALVALESQAMHAVEGRFLDGQKRFTVVGPPDLDLARRLMHGPEYHRAKAAIMAPIQDFFTRVESRTEAEVTQLRRRGERLHLVVIAGLGTAVVLTFVSFVLVACYPIAGAPRRPAPTSGDTPPAERRGRRFTSAIWTAWPLFVAAVVACVLVLCLSWWMSQSIEDRGRKEVQDALEAVHRTTVRSVDDWLTGIDDEASTWARTSLVRKLLTASGTEPAGPGAVELLATLRNGEGFLGYLVVDTTGRVVASDDTALVGRRVNGGLAERLVTELSQSPVHSTVLLTENGRPEAADGVEFPREILAAASVLDRPGNLRGVLVLRFDPRLDLVRILQQGRFGESGDTYAFTRSGWIIGDGRSRDRRRSIAASVVEPTLSSNAERHDHGRAGTAGSPGATRRVGALTGMAEAAQTGRSGLNIDGYLDYRGVPVIGAWTWNERYGIGIATEVGAHEAYGTLRDYLRQAHLGTGLSLVLIAGLSGMFVWNRLAMASAGARLEDAYDIIRDHMDRVEEELQVARDLQLSMVPRVFPAFPDRSDVSVYATLQPAREVGGDFYDFYFVDDTHLFFCLGDVSDKGVPAALFMAVTKTLIKSGAPQEPSTAKLVTYLNARLADDNPKCMFATLFAGRLDVITGELVYTNAGHDPPYLRHADGTVQRLDERHGPLAGVAPDVFYRESRRGLDPDDLLLLCTDGVTEARATDGRLFSEERVAEVVRAEGQLSTNAVVDRLLAAVEAFEHGAAERADDITVLALRVRPTDRADVTLAETVVLRNQVSELDRLDDVLDRLAQRGGLPSATMSAVRVACDEVISNVIAYAYPEGGDHEIEVRFELTGQRLVVTVSDDGVPFDPTAVPPPDTSLPLDQREPGGLGIHLVRSLVDEMAYARRGAHNVSTLVKDASRSGERSTS
ncbi:MAG TPA: SpoIIE family protein phosphatase [Candidatus Methylomirabilis sp.]|nr:SpoIIE family protein phosphatase [Candidatus Methylomirabilis sp.]